MSEQNVELVRALQPSSGVDLAEVFAGDPSVFRDAVAPLLDPSFECAFIANESSGFTTLAYDGAEGFVGGLARVALALGELPDRGRGVHRRRQ